MIGATLFQLSSNDARAQNDSEAHVRISWGGGVARTWKGSITIVDGSIESLARLGQTVDSPAATVLKSGRVYIEHWKPATYGGVELAIQPTESTVLKLELRCREDDQVIASTEIRFDELSRQGRSEAIDNAGNRYSIRRPDYDQIQVGFSRDHLVFDTAESFTLTWRPFLSSIATRRVRGTLKLRSASTKEIHFSQAVDFLLDENGSAGPQHAQVKMPNIEGVYRLEFVLEPVWFPGAFGNRTFRQDAVTRNIELIVISNQPTQRTKPRSWQVARRIHPVDSFDQANALFAGLPMLGNLGKRVPFGNDRRSITSVEGQARLKIDKGGWHALPIEFPNTGGPFRIEVDYFSDAPISMGLSLVEMAGKRLVETGQDSGVYLPPSPVRSADDQKMLVHQFTVWPNKTDAYLMIINRQSSHALTVGNVRVLSELAPVSIAKSPSMTSGIDATHSESGSARASNVAASNVAKGKRKVFLNVESPDFAELLGCPLVPDDASSLSLDGWARFHQAGQRLIDRIQSGGFNGAYLTVAADGSGIYPSERLGFSTRFDSGIHFSDGRDPVRKDVLEMLLRMFDREGLALVPTIDFNSPIPEVEAGRLPNGEPADFDLIDFNQVHHSRTFRHHLPVYNPLSPSVQRAIGAELVSVTKRYRSHPSFQGIGVISRPHSLTLLPGRRWGYDRTTIRRFSQSQTDFELPQDWPNTQHALLSTFQESWVKWRADQMTDWYLSIARAVNQQGQDREVLPQDGLAPGRQINPQIGGRATPFFLMLSDLYQNEELAAALSPSLHRSVDFERLMLQMGIDAASLGQPEVSRTATSGGNPVKLDSGGRVIVVVPNRIAVDYSPAMERVNLAVARSLQADHFFQRLEFAADLFEHRNPSVEFTQFVQQAEQRSLLEPGVELVRRQPSRPGGDFGCARFIEAIRKRDTRLIIDGGQQLANCNDPKLTSLFSIFRQLPDRPFEDVSASPAVKGSGSPVVVRQLKTANGTHFYLANASPWKVQVRMVVDDPGDRQRGEVNSYSYRPLAFAPQPRASTETELQSNGGSQHLLVGIVNLDPYELVGGRSVNPDWSLQRYETRLPSRADKELRRRVFELQAKLAMARKASPSKVLVNPRFELEPSSPIRGWDYGDQDASLFVVRKLESINVAPSSSPSPSSQRLLHLSNRRGRPSWIRSNLFATPVSGRLSIAVWIRTTEPQQQPQLRISIEGESDSGNYYRFGSLGGVADPQSVPSEQSQAIGTAWKRYAVHFDDLPIPQLAQVRIGFDLMSKGEVQMTDIAVYDHWLDDQDARAISQLLASTETMLLRPSQFDRCRRLLENYWAVFLDHYVAEPVSRSSLQSAPLGSDRQASGERSFEHDRRRRETTRSLNRSQKSKVPMFRRLRDFGARR